MEKTPDAQSPNENETGIPKVNELGAWMINHYKNHKGIPKEFFVRDVLKTFPSAEPAKIEKFYALLKSYQEEEPL
ncbi:MAG: hypothetical protein QMD21_06865 [Candidatus Thermoplasmatota archaeon]|nr:hypothetical protein [Candidatus Thermoplasmatota archaeon]